MDTNKEKTDNKLVINDELINEYVFNDIIISFLRKEFKKTLSRYGSSCLIRLLLQNRLNIHINDIQPKNHKLLRYNLSKFESNKTLNVTTAMQLKSQIIAIISDLRKDTNDVVDDTTSLLDGYIIDKNTTYSKVRQLICEEGDYIDFKYDFNNPDLPITSIENKDTLQRCLIQILNKGVKIDYPVEYIYYCDRCKSRVRMKVCDTVSFYKRTIKCDGVYSYMDTKGDMKTKQCGQALLPDEEVTVTKDSWFYNANYEDNHGNKRIASTMSFKELDTGFYEAVILKVKNPLKTETFIIMDIKPCNTNKFVLPLQKPTENYVYTLQQEMDKYIKSNTGMDIWGLYPIKAALIIQTAMNILGFRLIGNIQIVGSASTGKSTVLKYYSFLLNGQKNMSTNGLSVSIAGLRGTKSSILIMGKELKVVTMGYLGSYRSIHIDEAGENRELIQNLKTFLLEDNYSYDKAGAEGTTNRRTSHINVTENLDTCHLGMYRGCIRKAYKDMVVKIGNEEKEPWDENWDLHQPLYKYINNPYLFKIIKDKRLEFQHKQTFWIDGYAHPVHERFPFYFYLVNEKKDNHVLKNIIRENSSKNTISENLELIKVLRSDDLENFFKGLAKYKDSDNDVEALSKVDDLLDEYDYDVDPRVRNFYYILLRMSRIINQRMTVEKEDYDLVRYFIEKCNCKIDVTETADYKVVGNPNMKQVKQKELQIEEQTKSMEDTFRLPEGEF